MEEPIVVFFYCSHESVGDSDGDIGVADRGPVPFDLAEIQHIGMGIRNRDHERPAPSLLSDDPGSERIKLHERDGPGRNSGCVMRRRILGAKCRYIDTASAATLEGLGQLQSGFINTRKRIVRTWDDVAVERGNLVRITDRVENSSTRDKFEIGQKPEKVFLPLRLLRRAFRFVPILWRAAATSGEDGFPREYFQCCAGHTSRKISVREDCRYRMRQEFPEEASSLVHRSQVFPF